MVQRRTGRYKHKNNVRRLRQLYECVGRDVTLNMADAMQRHVKTVITTKCAVTLLRYAASK